MLLTLLGCEKEEKATVSALALSKSAVSLTAGESTTVLIKSGNEGYKVTSRDSKIASAEVSGTTISIEAKSEGATTVDVRDAKGKKASIAVTVKAKGSTTTAAITLGKTTLSLKKGAAEIVSVTGASGKYKAVSDKTNIATVKIVAKGIEVTGVEKGKAAITITDEQDSKISATLSVEVTDEAVTPTVPALELSESTVKFENSEPKTILIKSGSGEYAVQSAEAKTAEAVLGTDKTSVVITPVNNGVVDVTVTDSKNTDPTTNSKTITVKVEIPFAIDPAAMGDIPGGTEKGVLVGEKETVTVNILGGKAPFTAESPFPNSADASIEASAPRVIKITGGEYDGSIIPISIREADGTVHKLNVWVTQGPAKPLTLSEGEFEITVGEADKVISVSSCNGEIVFPFAYVNNDGPYVEGSLKPVATGYNLVFKALKETPAGTPVEVTITDARQQTAKLTITVKPEGASGGIVGSPSLRVNSNGEVVAARDDEYPSEEHIVCPGAGRLLTFSANLQANFTTKTVDCSNVEVVGDGVATVFTACYALEKIIFRKVYKVVGKVVLECGALKTVECHMTAEYLQAHIDDGTASFSATAFDAPVTFSIPKGTTAVYTKLFPGGTLPANIKLEERP